MLAEFQRQGAEVFPIDATPAPWTRWLSQKINLLHLKFYREPHHVDADPWVLGSRNRRLAAQVKRLRPDAVLCHGQPEHAAAIRSRYPLYIWTDALLPGMSRTHAYYRTYYGSRGVYFLSFLEKMVLKRCRRIWLTNEWAANDARRDFPQATERIAVQPFGANLAEPPSAAEIETALTTRNLREPQLLFFSTRWESKGGDEALAAVQQLRALGCPARFVVVGVADRPTSVPAAPWLEWVGPLDKRDPNQAARLKEILFASVLLLLPTHADCVPNVCTEACAFGVPIVATQIGGLPMAVVSGKNGALFPLKDYVAEAPAWIYAALTDRGRYETMARAARERFETTLNWSVNVRAVLAMMKADQQN
jgi:glycosyltransferase involved in cell wall biosynthesis